MLGLLRDPSKRARIATAARQRLERSYTWHKIVGDLEPKLLALGRNRKSSPASAYGPKATRPNVDAWER